MPRELPAVTAAKKKTFLEAFSHTGTIAHAAREAGFNPRQHWRWLERDPEYKERFQEAEAIFIDVLQRELFRRAVEGVPRPVFYKGAKVGEVTEYSDACLIFALKAHDPKYRALDRLELAGPHSGPIEVRFIPPNWPPDEPRAEVVIHPDTGEVCDDCQRQNSLGPAGGRRG